MDTLKDLLDKTPVSTGPAPRWKPTEAGQSVTGAVTAAKWVSTTYGTTLVVSVATGAGPVDVWCGQAFLARKMRDAHPVVGDNIAVRFDGEAPAAPGRNPAKLFTVRVMAEDGKLDPERTPIAAPGEAPAAEHIPF